MRTRTFVLLAVLAIVAVAVLAMFFSSARPDGLQRVAQDLGLGSSPSTAVGAWRAPVGLVLVAVVAGGTAWLVRRRDGAEDR